MNDIYSCKIINTASTRNDLHEEKDDKLKNDKYSCN